MESGAEDKDDNVLDAAVKDDGGNARTGLKSDRICLMFSCFFLFFVVQKAVFNSLRPHIVKMDIMANGSLSSTPFSPSTPIKDPLIPENTVVGFLIFEVSNMIHWFYSVPVLCCFLPNFYSFNRS
jgi:hypothetical protein